jgi:putative ABC transport system ATP-binding protein
VIQTRELAYRYPAAPAGETLTFHDLNLPSGSTLLLRGPSGSGKSTWLALAAGLTHATHGDVVVGGQSLGALSARQRDAWRARTLGFLPQRGLLSESLSVFDNLALVYFAAGRPVDRGRIETQLQALGVADLARRLPWQLSGGQAQRVALARALLLQPTLLLADEPTASLDDDACTQALQLLQQHASGATLVVATHDARVWQAWPQAQVLHLDPTRTAEAA